MKIKDIAFYVVTVSMIFWQHAASGQSKTFTNSAGMEFVLIEPGTMVAGRFQPPYPVPDDTVKGAQRPMTMWMGDGRGYNEEEFRLAKEMATEDFSPGFDVNIRRSFYIGKFEVTQVEWAAVMGTNPSVFRGPKIDNADRHPVENVTWDDVQKFIAKLNAMENGRRYRLPTEFEWEYAARAGASGDIPWDQTQLVAQLGGTTTQQVGMKNPNAWGLYDMLGNVWEWVDDFYNEKIFADPEPPTSGKVHVLKGASFAGDVKNATWLTHAGGPGNGWDVGFRIVLEITGEK